MLYSLLFLGIVIFLVIVCNSTKKCIFGHNMVKIKGSESNKVFYRDDLFDNRTYCRNDLSKYHIVGNWYPAYKEICIECGKIRDYVAEGEKYIMEEEKKENKKCNEEEYIQQITKNLYESIKNKN